LTVLRLSTSLGLTTDIRGVYEAPPGMKADGKMASSDSHAL
jgi:hypothetical protein